MFSKIEVTISEFFFVIKKKIKIIIYMNLYQKRINEINIININFEILINIFGQDEDSFQHHVL